MPFRLSAQRLDENLEARLIESRSRSPGTAQQVGAGDPIAGSRRQSSEKITFQWIKRRAAAGSDPSVVNRQARVAGFLEKCSRARLRLRRDEAVERCTQRHKAERAYRPTCRATRPLSRAALGSAPGGSPSRQLADADRRYFAQMSRDRGRLPLAVGGRGPAARQLRGADFCPNRASGSDPPKRKIAPQGRDSGCRSTLCPEGTGRWRRGWDSNPRYGITVNRISNPAHSTTLPPLRKNGRRTRVIGRPAYRSPHPGAHLSRCACFVLGACAATRGTQRKGAHDTGPRPGKQPVGGRIVRCATDRGRRGSRRARCAPRPGPPGGMPSAPDRDRCPRSRRARRDVRSRG